MTNSPLANVSNRQESQENLTPLEIEVLSFLESYDELISQEYLGDEELHRHIQRIPFLTQSILLRCPRNARDPFRPLEKTDMGFRTPFTLEDSYSYLWDIRFKGNNIVSNSQDPLRFEATPNHYSRSVRAKRLKGVEDKLSAERAGRQDLITASVIPVEDNDPTRMCVTNITHERILTRGIKTIGGNNVEFFVPGNEEFSNIVWVTKTESYYLNPVAALLRRPTYPELKYEIWNVDENSITTRFTVVMGFNQSTKSYELQTVIFQSGAEAELNAFTIEETVDNPFENIMENLNARFIPN